MKKQQGFGIIAAVFVILILSMLTLFSVSLFSSDIQIALDSLRSAQALYMCEGAMEFCIRFDLKDDPDWSNNADRVNIPIDRGTISLYYDPNTTTTCTTVRVVASVDDVTRKVACDFHRGWPEGYRDFPQSLYTRDDLTMEDCSNFSIEDPFVTNNTQIFPTISCDFGYYAAHAATMKFAGWYVDEASYKTYWGIIFVWGNVTFEECSDITINGTLVATGEIKFEGCNDITINPFGDNPALVAGSDITFEEDHGNTRNVDIRGMVYSRHDIFITDCDDFAITGILYADDHVNVIRTDDFRIDGSIIAHSEITFEDCAGAGPDINWGAKVLSHSPGFTWEGGSLVKAVWTEVF
ncbi:MAG: hypothetical protein ACMUIL_13175 [bacterium]